MTDTGSHRVSVTKHQPKRTENTTISYPWQPAPWSIRDHGITDANGIFVFRDPVGANVQIEALAPEMAEAILNYYDPTHGTVTLPCECCDKHDAAAEALHKVAERLRAIIKEQTPCRKGASDVEYTLHNDDDLGPSRR